MCFCFGRYYGCGVIFGWKIVFDGYLMFQLLQMKWWYIVVVCGEEE